MRIPALLVILLAHSGAALAADVIPVPDPARPQAQVAPAAEQPDGRAAHVVRGADGARAVVCGATVVTGVLGARFEPACADPAGDAPSVVRLIEGGFHAHVGGKAVRFELNGTQVQVRSAELIAARLKDEWIVQVKPLGETGSALVLLPTPPPAAVAPGEPDDAEAPPARDATPAPPPPPTEVALTPDKRFSLLASAEPQEATRRASLFLGKMVTRLLPEEGSAPARGPRLAARDVEKPADFAVSAGAAAGLAGDVEIEDIEVEVGCVEICVD